MDRLIVIYDDVDTDLGKIRVRKKGSAGTHNGMRNIIYMLGKDEFPRVRIGIGKSDRIPLKDYVLQRFDAEETVYITDSIKRSAEAVECIIKEGTDRAMNLFNG
jgi:PTH1 family peptidyl-tRNA hydrolase